MSMTEQEKIDNFKRLATKRTEKVLDDIRILGNCSSRYHYSYTEEEALKIFNTIEEELIRTKMTFLKPKKTEISL